jgi:DNA repair exonuclease SbcCD ATPase subunit
MMSAINYTAERDTSLYNENNHIRVYWEDTLDNYTKQNEKRIEKYFQDKYKTAKVKVVFKPIMNKRSDMTVDVQADASELILDDNYQEKLITQFLKENSIDINMEYLNKLDRTVSSELGDFKDQSNRYKSFKIKEIEFSNFLSYGEGNIIKIDKPGITSITSQPANFSGKSTLTVDLLSFLFFGVTSKTDKMEGIFNKFTDQDMVVVKGKIEIEGDQYIIKRILTRKESKGKGYTCKSEVDFYQVLPKGGIKQLNGEQRKFTDDLIKNYVGTYDDFLLTILATGDNLDDLIKTKPTERGRLLTRFIGLEFYREKEKIAKKLYTEWREKSNLHNTSVVDILSKITAEESRIKENSNLNMSNALTLRSVNDNLGTLELLKDTLLKQRINNVDTELYKIDEGAILEGIEKVERLIGEKKVAIKTMVDSITEPTVLFDVDVYQGLNTQKKEAETNILSKNFEIRSKTTTIGLLKDGEICVTCMRPLEGVDNTPKIKVLENEINILKKEIGELDKEVLLLQGKISIFDNAKLQWDEYNKNELIIGKAKAELSNYTESLNRGKEKLKNYRDSVQSIEKNKKIDTDLEGLKTKLNNANGERDLCMLQIKSIEKDIESSQKKIQDYHSVIKELKKDEVIDKIYKTYLEIYGKNGISKMILSTMIPLINSYLRMLLIDTAEFVLELRMDDKGDVEFLMVDTITEVEKPLYAGSGYEKTISSLALRCVLRKVCSLPKPNIIIFDEVTGKVANENLEKLGLFFDKIKLYFEHIWLISHNPLVQDWADNTIKVAKDNNISKILNENN